MYEIKLYSLMADASSKGVWGKNSGPANFMKNKAGAGKAELARILPRGSLWWGGWWTSGRL
jgi:hypothetical protein